MDDSQLGPRRPPRTAERARLPAYEPHHIKCKVPREIRPSAIYHRRWLAPGRMRTIGRTTKGTVLIAVINDAGRTIGNHFGFASGEPQELLTKALDIAESGSQAPGAWIGSFTLASGSGIEVGAGPGRVLLRWQVSPDRAALAAPKTRRLERDELPALRQCLTDSKQKAESK
jgi:hypothetical protein